MSSFLFQSNAAEERIAADNLSDKLSLSPKHCSGECGVCQQSYNCTVSCFLSLSLAEPSRTVWQECSAWILTWVVWSQCVQWLCKVWRTGFWIIFSAELSWHESILNFGLNDIWLNKRQQRRWYRRRSVEVRILHISTNAYYGYFSHQLSFHPNQGFSTIVKFTFTTNAAEWLENHYGTNVDFMVFRSCVQRYNNNKPLGFFMKKWPLQCIKVFIKY